MDANPSSEPVFVPTYRLLEQNLSAGTILRQALSIFFSNLAAFGLISFLVLAFPLAIQGWMLLQPPAFQSDFIWISLLVPLLFVLLSPLATGALTYGVFQIVRNQRGSLRDCVTIGFQRLVPVLLVSLFTGLAIMGGFILCIVPGFIVTAILTAAVPAAVIERPGIIGALRRSADLTKGFRWTAFGVFFMLGLVQFLAGLVLGLIQAALPMAWFAGFVLVTVVFTGLHATAGSLLYYHLRHKKESFDVEAIAQVFD